MTTNIIGLSNEQKQIVDSGESTVCIAGPGSGKTRVLTEKARKLVELKKDILCLCFTKSAAEEMSRRVGHLPATTIHSYCCQTMGWDESWGFEGLLDRFLDQPEEDFRKFDWVLVDEFQDLNRKELEVVLKLTGDKLFVVGDPYQSIYGFQGALGFNVLPILKREVKLDIGYLKENYRSNDLVVSLLEGVYKRDLVSLGEDTLDTTAILTRSNKDAHSASTLLTNYKIPHTVIRYDSNSEKRIEKVIGDDQLAKKLKVSTIHVSKGTEYGRVILYNWNIGKWSSPEEMRVYYVAVSRASRKFFFTASNEELLELAQTPIEG